jgi:hypothetical protein
MIVNDSGARGLYIAVIEEILKRPIILRSSTSPFKFFG